MGFAKKVLEYQQKKLVEAQNNLKSHLSKKGRSLWKRNREGNCKRGKDDQNLEYKH